MRILWLTLFSAGVVALDQYTKYLTVAHIAQYADVPFIPGFLGFTFVKNTGAAFSSFEGQQWLFALIFAVFTAAILWEYFKKPMPFSTFERWCIAAIYGGAMGNIIDRIFRGFVVDMIHLDFMNFPVFNVADCFITCGCIALFVSLAFFNKQFWKDEKKLKEE